MGTMKWIIPFLAVVCVTLALPKNEKAFSLFSVVTFPNNECTTMESTTMKGICKTAEECTESSGIQSGNCASGFGVCCYHTITVAGGATVAVTNNLTYIQNAGYPTTTGTSTTTASKTYTYTLAGGESICQIRQDFDDVELIQPTSAGGVCTATTADQLAATSSSTTLLGVGSLCGTLTGQHLYIHNDGAATVSTLTVTLGSATSGRKWKIKVTQIECDSMSLAPPGCLQYYTGSSGTITSFNGASTTNQMLQNQQYTACIRTEAGMCSFAVTQTRVGTATPDAFDLDGATSTASTSILGTSCFAQFAYLVIPNTGVTVPNYCGTFLAPAHVTTPSTATAAAEASAVISNVKPFTIGVVSLAAPNSAQGFSVNYSQLPC